MADKKLSLIQRAKVAISGSTKGIVPPLPSDSGLDRVGARLPTYDNKHAQLQTNLGWVYAANSAIVDEAAAVELKLYTRNKKGELEDVGQHDILELIQNPNSAHDGEAFRALLHTYKNLVGEAYTLMIRDGVPAKVETGKLPHALIPLPAHEVDFKLNKDGYSLSEIKYGQERYTMGEVIRTFKPDPASPYRGRSIISAAAAAIDTDEQMQSWNRRMFANNARPGLIFNLQGDEVDDETYTRLKQQVESLYSNDGVFRSLVVENGDVKPYMLNQTDLDFLASREFTRDEILAMFKVPSSVLGMSESYNRANIDGSRYINSIINIVPRLRDEVRMWNNYLVKPFDDRLELGFVNPVPEDVEAKLAEATAGVDKWLTKDEVRQRYGEEPLEGDLGGQIYAPINVTPLASIANPAKPQPAQDEDGNPVEGKKSLPKPGR